MSSSSLSSATTGVETASNSMTMTYHRTLSQQAEEGKKMSEEQSPDGKSCQVASDAQTGSTSDMTGGHEPASNKAAHTMLFRKQHWLWSILVFLLLGLNTGLFIWSNTSTAAIVWIDVMPGQFASGVQGLVDSGAVTVPTIPANFTPSGQIVQGLAGIANGSIALPTKPAVGSSTSTSSGARRALGDSGSAAAGSGPVSTAVGNAVGNAVTGAQAVVSGAVESAVNKTQAAVADAVNSVQNAVGAAVNNTVDKINDTVSTIQDTAGKINSTVSAIQGLMHDLEIFKNSTANSTEQHKNVFSFSLVSALNMMWETETYWLAILIVVMSGAWPYAKILIMGAAWFVPMEDWRRSKILNVIEFLGKWSLIDMFVMVIMAVTFPIAFSLGNTQFHIVVEPIQGFFVFVVAALINMIINHYIAFFHFRALKKEAGTVTYDGEVKPVGRYSARWSLPVYIVGGLAIVAGAAMMVYGLVATSYTVYTSGLAVFLNTKVPQSQIVADYTAITTGTLLPDKTEPYDSWQVVATSVLYMLFTVVMPCIWALCLMVVWLVPMRGAWKHHAMTVLETVFGFSAMDVFLMAIAAAVVELHQLAAGMMPPFCQELAQNETLDTSCFDVTAEFTSGFWVLLAGVATLYVMHFYTTSLEQRATLPAAEVDETSKLATGSDDSAAAC